MTARAVTFKEYALHRRCSVQAVYNAMNDGRLTARSIVTDPKGNRSILIAEADAEWASTTDPAMQQGSIQAKANAAAMTPMESQLEAAGEYNEVHDPGPVDVNDLGLELIEDDGSMRKLPAYNVSRAKKAEFDAKTRELEYRKAAGELVPVADVEKAQFKLARLVREQILAIPDRIASQLASEVDPHRVHVQLSGELRKALDQLTAGVTINAAVPTMEGCASEATVDPQK